MKEQILEGLFDSPIKFRLIRFFIRNNNGAFQVSGVVQKIKVNSRAAKNHTEKLIKLGFLNMRIQKRKKYYFLNKKFPFYNELKGLVLKTGTVDPRKFILMVKKLGKVLLAIVSGIFISEENSRIDLLLVGNLKQKKLKGFIQKMEAEVGAEIKYCVMTPKEFAYRYDMYDKFIRDIIDYRHEKLINKLKI